MGIGSACFDGVGGPRAPPGQAGNWALEARSSKASDPDESKVYQKLGLRFIPPELREGLDEIDLVQKVSLPDLITAADIKMELHADSTSSDGAHTIERMSAAAKARATSMSASLTILRV